MSRLAILFCGLLLAAFAQAQNTHKDMQGHGSMHEEQQSHKAVGTVTKVDPGKARATISHGAVETLKWPAMTMTFAVRDKALLEKLQPGRKVDFQFVQQGKDYVITGVK
jgi:Cu(I)/Ag(I) efflux system protein CusF